MSYSVTLLDKAGTAIATDHCDTLAEAKKRARYMLTDEWAKTCETTHATQETWKVEVQNEDEEIVFDRFLDPEHAAMGAYYRMR